MKRQLDWLLRSSGCKVLLEDEHLLVLAKPANLLVLPDRFNKALANLYSILIEELGKIYIVHRIDKETSGVIIFAKTAEAHAELNRQFENREVEKIYHAIVEGTPSADKGAIELYLSENAQGTMRVDRKGKEAVTQYSVRERFQGYALVEAKPKTGRLHQIRVHLKAIGMPLLCDKLYGNGIGFFLSQIKPGYKSAGEEKPLLQRTALHASSLTFKHPIDGKEVTLIAELPKDMNSVLKYLRKFRA
ncbi:MAG: RluA family pseudouridine synthase [Ignavibacteriae bacterium]|nr:RluA family pseudouridine synthase [Ignavibacteriota bacterium]